MNYVSYNKADVCCYRLLCRKLSEYHAQLFTFTTHALLCFDLTRIEMH